MPFDDSKPTMKRKPEVRLREAIREALAELGVPQPGYPQPVANAYQILKRALNEHP